MNRTVLKIVFFFFESEINVQFCSTLANVVQTIELFFDSFISFYGIVTIPIGWCTIQLTIESTIELTIETCSKQ